MLCRMRRLYQVSTIRIKLVVGGSEVVVYRCALKYSLLYAFAFTHLVIPYLYHNAEALYKKYTAEYRQHQLLVDDDGAYSYDSTNG